MKLSFAILTALLGTALASPALNLRQNDVIECVDGQEPTGGTWGRASECQDACFAREGADGDNKNGICKGSCFPFGRPLLVGFVCRGKGSS